MTERVIEERWVNVRPIVMNERLDTLRRRADHLAKKLIDAPEHARSYDAREHAALMWAIAELTGIGEELRREKLEREQITASMYRKAVKRAEQAETLNAQYRVTVAALKSELHQRRESSAVDSAKAEGR